MLSRTRGRGRNYHCPLRHEWRRPPRMNRSGTASSQLGLVGEDRNGGGANMQEHAGNRCGVLTILPIPINNRHRHRQDVNNVSRRSSSTTPGIQSVQSSQRGRERKGGVVEEGRRACTTTASDGLSDDAPLCPSHSGNIHPSPSSPPRPEAHQCKGDEALVTMPPS